MTTRLEWLGRSLFLRFGGSSQQIGHVARTQQRPNIYRAHLFGQSKIYPSTNAQRAKDWLRAEAARELELLLGRERARGKKRASRGCAA